jgi:predicted nucleotidyltransferase
MQAATIAMEKLPVDSIFSIEEIKSKADAVFRENQVKRAFLFGSYAHGNPGAISDVDIAVDTEGNISFLRVCGLMEELSQIFGKRVDLFDFREIEKNSGIMKEITQRGVLLYEAQQQASH